MNAIILAAGIGSRLLPYTLTQPKALTIINNRPIIEQQILFLKEIGIEEIHIVTGHLTKKFSYLIKKFHVNLIYNEKYSELNNIYSLYLAKAHLRNTVILEGDIYLTENILKTSYDKSFYFTGIKQKYDQEWILEFDIDNRISQIIKPDEVKSVHKYKIGAFVLTGISFWNYKDSEFLIQALEKEVKQIFSGQCKLKNSYFWDEIVRINLSALDVYIKKISSTAWFEIDTIEDISEVNTYFQDTNFPT